jgi:hypothetical protein
MTRTRSLSIRFFGFLACSGLLFALGCGPTESADESTADAPAASPPPAREETAKEPPSLPKPPPPRPRASSAERPDPALPHNKAIVDALAEPDFFTRMDALATVLPTLGESSIPQVRASLEDMQEKLSPFGPAEYGMLLNFWADHDPEGAARFAVGEAAFSYQLAMGREPVRMWAKKDPEAASQFFLNLLSSPGRISEVAETGLVWGWFESGKPGLEAFIEGLPPGPIQLRAIALFARLTIRRDGTEALAHWLDGLSDDNPSFKLGAYRQGGIAMGVEAPVAAAAWCDEKCVGRYANVRELVAKRYGIHDGPAALEWLSKMPEGIERDRAVRSAFGGWWQGDRAAARAWMEKQHEKGLPAYLDAALEIFAGAIARSDGGEYGMPWALRVQDETTRKRTMLNVARVWRSMDKEGADAWLETSPLTEEERENVRNPPRGAGAFAGKLGGESEDEDEEE